VPISIGAQTGSKPLQTLEAVLANMPTTAAREAASREATQKAFNAAALRRVGETADNAAPDVMRGAYQRLGGEFDRLSQGRTVTLGDDLLERAVNVDSVQAPLRGMLDTSAIDKLVNGTLDQLTKGQISGTTAQTIRSELTKEAKAASAAGNARLADAIKSLRDGFDDSIYKSMNPADQAAWDVAKRQYSNLKVIDKAMQRSGNAAAEGNIAPAALTQAVRQADPTRFARGTGDLRDLAQAGQLFVREQVPNSGTAQRTMTQNLITGGGFGGLGYVATGDPTVAVGSAGLALGGPMLVQALLRSKAGQEYLKNGLIGSTPARQTLADILRRASVAGAISLPQINNPSQ